MASDTLEQAGDVIQLAIPLVAFGMTYLNDDVEGRKQFAKSALTTGVAVHGLKYGVEKWRPNYSATNSFPSGHTASAFIGASFIQTRYGSKWGIPAYLAAGFVGYTRINAEKHYSDDVLAGASIAMLSNWIYTTPLDQGVSMTPVMTDDGYGLNVGFDLGGKEEVTTPTAPFNAKYRFAFSFGALNIDNNDLRSPTATGSHIDLENFDTYSSPTTSSRVDFEYFIDDRHEVAMVLNPLEVRDETVLDTPETFNGVTFPGGVATQMEYNLSEIRGVYRYKLVDENRFDFKVGAGLAWQYTWARIVSGALDTHVESHDFLPYLSAQANFDITPKLMVQLQVEGMEMSNNSMLDSQVSMRYKLSPQWDVGIGARKYHRELNTSELSNKFKGSSYFLTVAHSF